MSTPDIIESNTATKKKGDKRISSAINPQSDEGQVVISPHKSAARELESSNEGEQVRGLEKPGTTANRAESSSAVEHGIGSGSKPTPLRSAKTRVGRLPNRKDNRSFD